MQAERHRLIKDIQTIIEDTGGGRQEVLQKWAKHFREKKWLNEALREIAKKELPRLQAMYGTLPKLDKNPKAFK